MGRAGSADAKAMRDWWGGEPEAAVVDTDTSEVSSLRSLVEDEAEGSGSHGEDEAVSLEGGLAPRGEGFEDLKRTQRNKCEVASINRKRQLEEEKKSLLA